MTTMTITTATTNGPEDAGYFAGRADAYDEHGAGATTEILNQRAQLITDLHPDMGYVLGYTDYVLELRRETALTLAAHSDIAHRKTGRR
ncbi:hypothetical protein ACIPW9_36540 [Streptomyces sp. NPDC090052]|uniref:hypothetical protein n=1 Tax=Streptomyces sp. NPDC090052 TaxID=3365931 RepID=UPI0037F7C701